MTASGICRAVTRSAVGAAIVGLAMMGVTAPAHAAPDSPDDIGCVAEPLSPICSGGPYSMSPAGGMSEGLGGLSQNIDGIPSPPGMPGDI